jgi:hypothetical protein
MSCSPFWLDDPRVLVAEASEFFPFTEHDRRCTASALNSFTRFGVYLGVALAIVRMEIAWLLVGVFFAAFSVGAWKFMTNRGSVKEGFGIGDLVHDFIFGRSEGFESPGLDRVFSTEARILDPRDVINEYVPDVIGLSRDQRTHPTPANPFMNVLVTEIGDNPYRAPAASVLNQDVRVELDTYFQTMFASDPGDVFNHTSSQRAWVAAPVTTIPNDQSAFANWLYRVPGQTYKEGNMMASQHVNTGADTLPWRSLERGT